MSNGDMGSTNSNFGAKPDPFEKAIEGLDMTHVDGISCQTVHPIAVEVAKAEAFHDDSRGMITRVQNQVIECLSVELTNRIGNRYMPGVEIEHNDEGVPERITLPLSIFEGVLKEQGIKLFMADMAVRQRLGLSEDEATMPSGFILQQAFLLNMIAAIENNDEKRANDFMQALMVITKEYAEMLSVIGVKLMTGGEVEAKLLEIDSDDDADLPDDLRDFDGPVFFDF